MSLPQTGTRRKKTAPATGFIAAADAPMAYPDLRMTRERVVRAIQSGKLRGMRDRERGWLVERASITEYLKSAAA